jgi:hypothetical protein
MQQQQRQAPMQLPQSQQVRWAQATRALYLPNSRTIPTARRAQALHLPQEQPPRPLWWKSRRRERKRAHWTRAMMAPQRRRPQAWLGAQLQRLVAAPERARHVLRQPAPLRPKQQKAPQATKAQTAQAQQKIAAKRGHPQQEQLQPVQQGLAQQQEMAQEEQQQGESSLQSSPPEETRTPAMKVQKRQELQKFAAKMGHRSQVPQPEEQQRTQQEQEQQEWKQPEPQSW